jgi:hypothetical protein
MAEYRDPKVTTPTGNKGGGMSRWIWIALAALVVLLLLWWLFAGDDEVDAVVTDEGVVTEEPVIVEEEAVE